MKLGSLKNGHRDGALVVVSRDLTRYAEAGDIAPSLRGAIESWVEIKPLLSARANLLEAGDWSDAKPFIPEHMASPLPRAFQWADGSAYLSHMRLVRKARGVETPSGAETEPLLYQGGSDAFLCPTEDIPLKDETWGLDFEAEIAVIVDDVPMGTTADAAKEHIKLIMLCNDVSLREIMRPELQKGFGFFQSKPASSFSPVCVVPEELGAAWNGGKVSLPLVSTFNGEWFGAPNAGVDLTFDFPALIAHAVRTRDLMAGTIIGSGTVSNEAYREVGSSCLIEKRMIEILDSGETSIAFMKPDDRIRIEMFGIDGCSIFGAIDQKVVAA